LAPVRPSFPLRYLTQQESPGAGPPSVRWSPCSIGRPEGGSPVAHAPYIACFPTLERITRWRTENYARFFTKLLFSRRLITLPRRAENEQARSSQSAACAARSESQPPMIPEARSAVQWSVVRHELRSETLEIVNVLLLVEDFARASAPMTPAVVAEQERAVLS